MSRNIYTPFLSSRWRLVEGSLDLANAATTTDPRINHPGDDITREADRWMSIYGEHPGEPGDHPAGLPDAVVLAVLPALCAGAEQSDGAQLYLKNLLSVAAAKVGVHSGQPDHHVAAAARENARLGAPPPSGAMRGRYTPTNDALAAKWTAGRA